MQTPCATSRWLLSPLAALAALFAATATAQERTDDPVTTYRSFLHALDRARSLEDLVPYLPASARDELAEVPDEMVTQILEGLRATPPPEGWEVVARRVTHDRARLVLRGRRSHGGIRTTLEATPELLREDDGWKVEHPEPWYEVEILPEDLGAAAAPPPIGPGAVERRTRAFDPAAYRPHAQAAGSGEAWEGSVVFDPRGRYVALGNTRSSTIRLLELDNLREAWAARVPHAYGTLTFRSDGRALAFISGDVAVPEVLPLMANLERDPPERGYFFSRPTLPQAAAAVEGRPDWSYVAYHPHQPILALALGDYDDEEYGAIVIQPTGDGLWSSAEREPPQLWRTQAQPWELVWAPAGERLAWRFSPFEPGSPVYVRDYPAGEEARMPSRPDFNPLSIAFGPGGRHLAAVGEILPDGGRAVVVWDAETGAELASLPGIARAAFAPDGRHLFAVRDVGMTIEPGVGDEILVWELGAPEPVHTIPAFPPGEDGWAHYVADLAVSPNGRFLIAVSDAGDVRVWDAEGGP